MHKEILIKEQLELLPLVKSFSKDFGLVGGTAIALHLGHRHSIDFDLFTDKKFDNNRIRSKIKKQAKIDKLLYTETGQFNLVINGVKLTFFQYPFKLEYSQKLDNIIKLPDLLTLAAMKAYAIGMRAKWKDCVDLYFIIRDYYSIDKIAKKAKQIFNGEFNERMFRSQLAYFEDVDYQEKVIYLPSFEVPNEKIKKTLIKFSLEK